MVLDLVLRFSADLVRFSADLEMCSGLSCRQLLKQFSFL